MTALASFSLAENGFSTKTCLPASKLLKSRIKGQYCMLRSQVGHGVRQASIDKKQVMAFNDDPCGPFRPMAMESIG